MYNIDKYALLIYHNVTYNIINNISYLHANLISTVAIK